MKEYLKMADVFPSEIYTDDESGSLIVDNEGIILESFSGDKVADYALHAINSHDDLVKMNSELLEVISRVVSRADEFNEMIPTSDWANGYRGCVVDTGKALKAILGKIEGGAA